MKNRLVRTSRTPQYLAWVIIGVCRLAVLGEAAVSGAGSALAPEQGTLPPRHSSAAAPKAASSAVELKKWQAFINEQWKPFAEMPAPKQDLEELLLLKATGKIDSYASVYVLAVNRRSLAGDALTSAAAFLNKRKLPGVRKYAGLASRYYAQSNDLFAAADQVVAGAAVQMEARLNGIYRSAAELSRLGWTVACGTSCGEIADHILLATDYAVDSSLESSSAAKKNLLSKVLVSTLLDTTGVAGAIDQAATRLIGRSGLYGTMQVAIADPEFVKSVMQALARTGSYGVVAITQGETERALAAMLEFFRRAQTLEFPKGAAIPSKLASYADIRSVDFRNAEYPSGCSGLIRDPRFSAVIDVKNGEWETGPNASDAYFSVNHVFYDDVDGDGRAEAIVTTVCSIYGANYWETEVYVFQLVDGQPRLVQRLSSNDWYGPEGGYRVAAVGVLRHEIRVSYFAGGSHAQPAWEITAEFRWNGNRFVRAHTDRRAFRG
jgi:hypothetical protein